MTSSNEFQPLAHPDMPPEPPKPYISMPSPGPPIINLPIPLEVRLMIYEFLVIDWGRPIFIDRPKRLTAQTRELYARNLAAVAGVNKQINAEVMMVFYSKNVWAVGNGPYGSTSITNAQALKRFISTVPRQNLAQIRKVVC